MTESQTALIPDERVQRLEFVVHGTPQPAGSKRAFKHPSTERIIVTDDNRKSAPWKHLVAQAAGESFVEAEPWAGPIRLTLTFYMPRPKGHFGTGRNADLIKESAPPFPTKKPDTLKLARGVEDALSGIVYKDDAQIVDEHLFKRWGTARVEVLVERIGTVSA